MPKKTAKPVEDDLDLDEEETEEEDDTEDDDEEDAEEEDSDDDEEEEEEEEEKPVKPKGTGKPGRPKGSKNSTKDSVEGGTGIVLLKTGIPKKVSIVRVTGKNCRVRKAGDKSAPIVRVPVTEVRLYDEETFEKMETIAEKITALIDKNLGAFSKLPAVAARKSAQKKNPMDEL